MAFHLAAGTAHRAKRNFQLMPVVLSQIFSPSERVYKDAEWSLYHYPRQYFTRITPFDRFIYYRPHGKRAPRRDSYHYFGHGVLGTPHDDPFDANHRYVPLVKCEPFRRLVPLRDPAGLYYETESDRPSQAQSAVRTIGEIAFQRILAAGEVSSLGISLLPSTDEIAAASYFGTPISAPTDGIRVADRIPEGAGYVPQPGRSVDVYESAALQERARADHQRILRLLHAEATRRGATCWYNNNIDLVMNFGNARNLVEAKSLSDLRDAVNRMRYGIGQLADYQVRYRAELHGAKPLLAFGRPPDRDTSWIATILQETGIGFLSSEANQLVPLNELARESPIFS
jgi:hypothetical protein